MDQNRPMVVIDRPAERRDVLEMALRLATGFLLIVLAALLSLMLLMMGDLADRMGLVGENLKGLGATGETVGTGVQRAVRGFSDLTDPAHPPFGPLRQDTEIDQLQRVSAGEVLGEAGGYVLTVASIERRAGAGNPDEAQYVVVHRKLGTPRQARVGPLVVREDWEEADYYLYKGESFRLGPSLYRVNWVSAPEQGLAVVRYRNAGDPTVMPKFQIQ